MHDIRAIRADPSGFDAALGRRGLSPASGEILGKDAERRAALTALQELQARRNALSKVVAQGRRAGTDTSALEAEAAALRQEMEGLEKRAAGLDEAIKRILAGGFITHYKLNEHVHEAIPPSLEAPPAF